MAELVRGKCGRVIGDLSTLIVLLKGLPLAYNRDMQEDKPPVFDAFDTVNASLHILSGSLATAHFHEKRMRAALAEGFVDATEVADYLVTKGVPFREAHDIAGHLVRVASGRGVELAQLTSEELRAAHASFGPDLGEWLDPARAVDRRDLVGGPARSRVVAEIERIEAELG
jgi:argininosuccinate lyase